MSAAAAAGLLGLIVTSCGSDQTRSPAAPPTPTASTSASAAGPTPPSAPSHVPAGWRSHRVPGFQLATPPSWADRPAKQRVSRANALEIGVPYTGQSYIPPVIVGFAEPGKSNISLTVREQGLREELRDQLPTPTTLGPSRHVHVAGATDALMFDIYYRLPALRSVTGTRIKAAQMHERALLLDSPGQPKLAFRFGSAARHFDGHLWEEILATITVDPTAAVRPSDPSTPTGPSAPSGPRSTARSA